jgi:hypothetical protein
MMTEMMLASWETIARRTLMIARDTCTPAEYRRMVIEKVAALQRSTLAGMSGRGTRAVLAPWHEIIDKVWGYSERSGIRGRTVTLKVKFANFRQITRSRTGQTQIKTRSELEQLGNALLEPLFPVTKGVRLLGLSLSSLAARSSPARTAPRHLHRTVRPRRPCPSRLPQALIRCGGRRR